MAHRSKPDPSLDVELPITPMLDVAFQVLLFFILTYHPAQFVEGQMELALPDAAKAQAATPLEAKPDPSMPGEAELPSEITVVVRTKHDGSHDGGISQISVQERQGSQDFPDQETLRKYLEEARSGLTNQNDIKIRAESELKYGSVIEIMDACTRAGFRSVGFGPPPDQTEK
jgi:biopolymer transport protein ExbD